VLEEQALTEEAGELLKTQSVREKFTVINHKRFYTPDFNAASKSRISIQVGKLTFCRNQLKSVKSCSKICLIFYSNRRESRPFVTALFWASDEVDERCFVMRHLKVVKKEIACLGVDIKTEISYVFAPTIYLLNLLENSFNVSVVNIQRTLDTKEEKQFEVLQHILCKHQHARQKRQASLRIVSSLIPLDKHTRKTVLSQFRKFFDPLRIFSPFFTKA